jgi:lysophospholipase L1-like esterase
MSRSWMSAVAACAVGIATMAALSSAQVPAGQAPPQAVTAAGAGQAPGAPAGPVPPGGRGQAAPPLSLDQLTCPELAAAVRMAALNDARLRDWAQIGRYRQANQKVTKADVVFMGDSITDFWPQPRFGEFFPGKNYVGRGISAQTTPQMLIRMRPDVVALKPKAVVILAGTNDIAGNTGPMTDEEIEGNLASMAEIAMANDIKVIFTSVLPTSNYHVAPNGTPQTSLRPLARIQALNAWMKKYAADHKQFYVDYYSAMIDAQGMLRAELSADDLHPNKAGYAVMAPLVEQAIERAVR